MSGIFLFLRFSLCSFFLQKVLSYGYPKIKHEKQNNNVTKQVLCSKLDRDVLGEIMSKLCSVDQARFHAVCKAFRVVHPINTLKSLPWLVSVDCSVPMMQTLKVELYDPSTPGLPASVHRISLAKSGIRVSSKTYTKILHTNGWLLMFIAQENGIPCKHDVLVYSPLTKQLIQLPPYYSDVKRWYVATCSTDPSSRDCIFFVAETYEVKDKCTFRTIRKGDKKWTAREFNRSSLDFGPCMPKIVYIEGIFYLFTRQGQLASYNFSTGEFKYENILKCADFSRNLVPKVRNCEGFMLNGEFMIMIFGTHPDDLDKFPEKPCIKSYDWSKKVWIPVRSLGDQTLFVRQDCFGVATIGKKARDDNRILSNKIYFFFKAGCIIYSFENGDLVQFKYYPGTTAGTITSCVTDSGYLLEFKYNSWNRYGNNSRSLFWFDPPVIKLK